MPLTLLSKWVVITPGTLVPLTSIMAPLGQFKTVQSILFQAMSTNLGRVYIGTATLNRAALTNVSAVLAIPTANTIPSYGISNPLSPAGVDIDQLYLDADVAGEGVLVTVLQT